MSKTKVRVTVAKFDDRGGMQYANVRDGVKLKDFPALSVEDYRPMGGTPLRDATMTFITSLEEQQASDRVIVGLLLDESGSMSGNVQSVIKSANEFVRQMADVKKVDSDAAGKVLAVVLTDGYENASRETTVEALQKRISEKEAAGWTFIYLGANQDAWSVGQSTGFSGSASGQAVQFRSTPVGTASAMADVSNNAVSYLTSNKAYMVQAAASSLRSVDEGGKVTTKDGDVPAWGDPQSAANAASDALSKS